MSLICSGLRTSDSGEDSKGGDGSSRMVDLGVGVGSKEEPVSSKESKS